LNKKSWRARIRDLRLQDNLTEITDAMKCNKCAKQATFHITDLTGDGVLALHLCPDCAKQYLQTEEGEKTDASAISFYEFRQGGRLGCPHDYVFFSDELEPLLQNVHGENKHVGKQPKRGFYDAESQTELIRLRREMKEAVEQENYEEASKIRDQIREIASKGAGE